MAKITITDRQAAQFNRMRATLKKIAKDYQSPNQMHDDEDCKFLGFEDFITMAYENIQEDARAAIKNVRAIVIPIPEKKNEPIKPTA